MTDHVHLTVSCIKLSVAQGIDTYLVAPAAEFGQNIGREHFGIAAGYIQVDVFNLHQAQQYIDEADLFIRSREIGIRNIGNLLDLIQKDIVHFCFIGQQAAEILSQLQRITVADVLILVQRQLDNLIVRNADRVQILMIELEQQIGFSAPTDAGDNLDQSILSFLDQLVQVTVTLYLRFSPHGIFAAIRNYFLCISVPHDLMKSKYILSDNNPIV